MKGLYTLEKIQKERRISKQSALNFLSRLRKKGLVKTLGGGKQKRLYKISETPHEEESGMYYIINKYTPVKLYPKIFHFVHGRPYSVERTIIDCIKANDARHQLAAVYLFNRVKNWKLLEHLTRESMLAPQIRALYELARKTVRARRMPDNFSNYLGKYSRAKLRISESDVE